MYRERLQNTRTKSPAASALREAMLDYHDFQKNSGHHSPPEHVGKLANWQSQRLKFTHKDLYAARDYRQGLDFLFSDLYAPQDFSQRDQELERIFPKLVKFLPDRILSTVAILIELNLITQKLDHQLSKTLFQDLEVSIIDASNYCEAYRQCNNFDQRLRQIQMIHDVGHKLERYSRSSVIHYSLKLTEHPAEMAGLGALHNFIMRGFDAFHSMRDVKGLMKQLVDRETTILNRIYQKHPNPFVLSISD